MKRSTQAPEAGDVLLLGLMLIGLVLRCWGLGQRGVWWDEACLWGEAFTRNTAFQEAPLNTWLTRLLMEVIHRNDVLALHLPAALFGTLHIPASYRLGRALSGRPAGILVALLVAVSPPLIYFAQEARPYSLLILMTTMQLAMAVELLEEWRVEQLVWLAIFTAGAIATHLLALPFSLALGLVLLLAMAKRRVTGDARAPSWRQLGTLFLVGAAAMALGAAWVPFRPRVTTVLAARYLWGPAFFVRYALEHATTLAMRLGPKPWPWSERDVIAGAYVSLALVGVAILARRRRLAAALALVLPPIALLVCLYFWLGDMSWSGWSRYSSPGTIPLLALACVAVAAAPRAWMAALVMAALLFANTNRRAGWAFWLHDLRIDRGDSYRRAAGDVMMMSAQLRGVIFVMQRSPYGDETIRSAASYELYRHDSLPQFHTRDGIVYDVRLERGPGRVPIPRFEDVPAKLEPGDYAVFNGWDKRPCAEHAPVLRDSPVPYAPTLFKLCRVP